MKASLPALLLLAVFPFTLHAAPKGKKRPAAPAPAAQPAGAEPAAQLEPYIANLDMLLALQRPKKKSPLVEQAPGRLVTLRLGFVTQREQAPEDGKAKLDAAIATCDALSAAFAERQKALGDMKASQAMQTGSKLNEGPRKDNLNQGLKGNGEAKAVGSIVELKREQAAKRDAKARSAADSDAMDAMALNRWNKRSMELKQQIVAAYSRIH